MSGTFVTTPSAGAHLFLEGILNRFSTKLPPPLSTHKSSAWAPAELNATTASAASSLNLGRLGSDRRATSAVRRELRLGAVRPIVGSNHSRCRSHDRPLLASLAVRCLSRDALLFG